MRKNFLIAEQNWLRASKDLSFKVISPYLIDSNGSKITAFAFIPEYGGTNGTIVGLISSPNFEIDQKIVDWALKNDVHYSFINIDSCLNYKKDFFQEILMEY